MLLAGEMPEDIEAAFVAAGAPLFPKSERELKTACSCPDFSNPCKHIAAVFYLIGEEFDRDPFLLFVVRGLPRAGVRDLLAPPEAKADTRVAGPKTKATTRNGRTVDARTRSAGKGNLKADEVKAANAVAADAEQGKAVNATAGATHATIAPPAVDAILLQKAGRFPFWRAAEELDEALAPVYARATGTALAWLADHRDSST